MHDEYADARRLMQAILDNAPDAAEDAIAAGANVNAPDEDGEQPLCIAAYEGNDEVVRVLLEHGADPSIRNEFDEPVLVTASMEGHLAVVRQLVEHGADIGQTDFDGHTAIQIAEFYGHMDICDYLREQEALAATSTPDDTPPRPGRSRRIGARLIGLFPHRNRHAVSPG
jgi:hypothetical protein